MRKQFVCTVLLLGALSIFQLSCHKNHEDEEPACSANNGKNSTPCFNLNVVLHGKGNQSGYIKFRQDPDTARIIKLETKIEHLSPQHEYLLQRAVDPVNVVDGNCTSTTWLTLGKGLIAQTILTDAKGSGTETLWRDITTAARGSTFDIHFQIVDKATMAVVLTSDCYQYTVR
jgi:hypothetical protein